MQMIFDNIQSMYYNAKITETYESNLYIKYVTFRTRRNMYDIL